ncbi:hypothetical protein D9619_009559 [Psilocybe cf. subviscida]|uniref:BTB domain-containing protein n=1 Tax=Psilocybe cf. subviscida TaxID=2480587 RepID=A0A8H5BKK6_9AGAR|nr:hypothetical protein D9619_009559 [Psilocybe cf. subviscida]
MAKRTSLSKRKRVDTNGGEAEQPIFERQSSQDWKEDKEFYLRDGDVTVLADRTRFKLSRFVLRRGSPLMEKLLESPEVVEMTLTETTEDVRALSWATHSLPTKASKSRLISALYICHKLQFFPHAQWAKRVLFKSTRPLLSGSIFCDASELDIAKLLMALSPCALPECPVCKTKNSPGYVRAVWGVWLLRLQTDASVSLRRAIDCAQTLGLRSFLGHLYYTQLVVANAWVVVQRETSETAAFEDLALNLTAEQTSALYRGHWSLSRFWDSVRWPPEVDTPDQASHDWECCLAWEEMWFDGIHGDGESPYQWNPVGALLRLSQTEIPTENDEFSADDDEIARCGCFFREEACRVRQQLLETLADHFMGPCTSTEAQAPPDLGQINVIVTPTAPASVRDERPTRHKPARATASPKVRNVKPKQPQKTKSKKQKKLEAKAAKKVATTKAARTKVAKTKVAKTKVAKAKVAKTKVAKTKVAKTKVATKKAANKVTKNVTNADVTTAILLRGWELQHPSGSAVNDTVALSDQTEHTPTVNVPECSRDEPLTLARDDADRQPSVTRDASATADASSALELNEHISTRVYEPIVIEDTPPPPPPPLDRTTSPNYWGESEGEQPSQNSYLYYREGAEPAKIPKAMFGQHGKPIRNHVDIGEEDAEVIWG